MTTNLWIEARRAVVEYPAVDAILSLKSILHSKWLLSVKVRDVMVKNAFVII
jgi:hypothetical protein